MGPTNAIEMYANQNYAEMLQAGARERLIAAADRGGQPLLRRFSRRFRDAFVRIEQGARVAVQSVALRRRTV